MGILGQQPCFRWVHHHQRIQFPLNAQPYPQMQTACGHFARRVSCFRQSCGGESCSLPLDAFLLMPRVFWLLILSSSRSSCVRAVRTTALAAREGQLVLGSVCVGWRCLGARSDNGRVVVGRVLVWLRASLYGPRCVSVAAARLARTLSSVVFFASFRRSAWPGGQPEMPKQMDIGLVVVLGSACVFFALNAKTDAPKGGGLGKF